MEAFSLNRPVHPHLDDGLREGGLPLRMWPRGLIVGAARVPQPLASTDPTACLPPLLGLRTNTQRERWEDASSASQCVWAAAVGKQLYQVCTVRMCMCAGVCVYLKQENRQASFNWILVHACSLFTALAFCTMCVQWWKYGSNYDVIYNVSQSFITWFEERCMYCTLNVKHARIPFWLKTKERSCAAIWNK